MNPNKKLRLIKAAIKAAKEFEQQGKIQESVDDYLRAAELLKGLKGAEMEYARALNNAVIGLINLAQYSKAKQLIEKALLIQKKYLGGEHIDVAVSLNSLATIYSKLGNYEQAKGLCQRTLAIREKQLGDQHPNVARSLNNLATVYGELGDYEQAKELYQRALAIREKKLGDQHPDVATSLSDLAIIYTDLGNYEQAKELHQRSLAIREKQLGEQHPDVARSLNNLATVYSKLGDNEQAKELCQRALAIQEKQLGELHPDVAASLNNLANVYSDLGAYEQAKELHLRALAIREKQLEAQHSSITTSLNNLATVYNKLGEYEQAIKLHQRALAIREKQLGDQHPDVAKSLNNLANVCSDLGEYERAKELYQRARSIVAKTLGEQHPLAKSISENYFELQKEVAELQQELIEAEKFKFLGQIMTQVAHNINNPLQIIHGRVTGALDDLNEELFNAETELRPLLEILKRQTDRISNLIQDFRKLAQGDRKKLETVDLNQLAQQAAEYLRDQFLINKIQLIIEPTHPTPLAHSNALVVTESIVNLLSNAKDALIGQNDAKVTLSTWEDAQYVGIKVEDNGIGVHPDQQTHLFRSPFPSQKTVGMGLGLYTSHHTLKSLGGKIVYTSQDQGGACFTIILKKAKNHV